MATQRVEDVVKAAWKHELVAIIVECDEELEVITTDEEANDIQNFDDLIQHYTQKT